VSLIHMDRVKSKDGTSIAYDRLGRGPAVILVGGALDDGSENAPLAKTLAANFTVYNYARRGRGASGDTPPYDVQREVEDIAALLTVAGRSAHLFGVSSGGMFAFEAAAAGLRINRLAVYEVPYDPGEDAPQRYRTYRRQLNTALLEGRRGDAVSHFMRLAGSSDADVETAKTSPYWKGLEALAHTLAYDAACYGRPPAARLATITQPTLVATGGVVEFFELAADAVAAAIPNARRLTLDGQGHGVDPKIAASILERFFNEA
jgi:pimeloyl-ACP methyl ester carboxylesterase